MYTTRQFPTIGILVLILPTPPHVSKPATTNERDTSESDGISSSSKGRMTLKPRPGKRHLEGCFWGGNWFTRKYLLKIVGGELLGSRFAAFGV